MAVKLNQTAILLIERMEHAFAVQCDGVGQMLYVSADPDLGVHQAHQLHFFIVLKFLKITVQYSVIDQRPEGLHQVTGQIKGIEPIIMEQPQLSQVSVCGNFPIEC